MVLGLNFNTDKFTEDNIIPPYTNPTFKQIYAPIDGVVANVELKIKM